MTPIVRLILLVFAFACFILAAFGVVHPKINFTALGLALWVLTLILS